MPASRSASSTISWVAAAFSMQHRELVAAPARDGVLGGHDGPQPPGRLGEHQVARAVPDQVVDRGEAVEVEEDDARHAARPTGSSASRARSST